MHTFFNLIASLLNSWWVFHILAVVGAVIWVLVGGSLRKVAKFFLYVAVLSVLIVMTSTFFPFIGGKDYFFRITIELALIFYILWIAFEAKAGEAADRFRAVAGRPIFIAVSAFMLAFLLASIFANDPNAAFWSNYERGEGGFQMLHYYGFFVLLVLLFERKEDWLRLFKVSVWTAVLMIAYGVAANLGLAPQFISTYQQAPEGLWQKLVEGRFHGSLGNPAYVAPYLIFTLFYLSYLWNASAAKRARKFLTYGGLMVIFLFFFMLTQTRAGILGLGAAVFVFLVYLIAFSPKWRKFLAIALVALVLLGGLVFRYKDSQFIGSLPGGRIFNISFSAQTVNTRLWTWGSAWKGFLERPLLGWGPENFSAVFDKHFDPRHHVPGKQTETWFDRAHSIYFDYLAETGILGLLAYMSIFAVIFWRFVVMWVDSWRRNRATVLPSSKSAGGREVAKRTEQSVVEQALVFSMSVGYLVQGIPIFDVFPIYINVFLFFAFTHYYFYMRHENVS